MTMKEFLEQNCWTTFAVNVMTSLVRVVLAVETYELSVLSFAWYISAAQVNYNSITSWVPYMSIDCMQGDQKSQPSLCRTDVKSFKTCLRLWATPYNVHTVIIRSSSSSSSSS